MLHVTFVLLASLWPVAWAKSPSEYAAAFHLDRPKAQLYLNRFTVTPHPFGSAKQLELLSWLESELKRGGLAVNVDEFQAKVPDPKGPGTLTYHGKNLIVSATKNPPTCAVALASHTDSKHLMKGDYVGANDSASSAVALMQMLLHLKKNPPPKSECGIIGIFFDGEESVLWDWNEGETLHPTRTKDNTYGSRHLANELAPCSVMTPNKLCFPQHIIPLQLKALVLMDMIGSPNLQFSYDAESSPELLTLLRKSLAELNLPSSLLDSQKIPIQDDHIPFLAKGIPALNIIDFKNLGHWHKPTDVTRNLDLSSIEKASRIALLTALKLRDAP